MDVWLKLRASHGGLHHLVGGWIESTSSGPCLVSLSTVAGEENKTLLSNTCALAIHHLIYSCPLLGLRLMHLELKELDWDVILGGIHCSILKKLSLRSSNVPGSKKYKVVIGS